ncbi:MAG: MBOAT family O-acyltransferase [Planctomycetota bacterium]|jgi:D-alanyl-lipoteichoic acid acyltransferase DltB (MBOAT superfamily)
MNFNSATFALFIAVVGVLYVALQRPRLARAQRLMLLVASYAFYGAWDHRFLLLILLSTAIDYCCGLGITDERPARKTWWAMLAGLAAGSVLLAAPFDWGAIRTALLPDHAYAGGWEDPAPWQGLFVAGESWRNTLGMLVATVLVGVACQIGFSLHGNPRRRFFLVLSLVSNLTLLGFFKYFDFFVDSLATLTGLDADRWLLGIVVPVGISFYTFQTLSYTIDIYRGEFQPTRNLLNFALFVAFFPQLVAGPIERARVLLPQLERHREFNWGDVQVGFYLVCWGLFKKIFIADNLARMVTVAYGAGADPTGPVVLFSTYAFAFQIYCDFSGYTDIARGVSRMMGVELMVNFNIPYHATNPREFWRRWHISLSTWLRDYLYISLGGGRGGPSRVYRNLMLTMVLGGLWHGARANFIWWGVYQGGLLCLHRLIEPRLQKLEPGAERPLQHRLFRFACWFLFFQLVCYGWLIFRVDTNAQLWSLTRALGTGWGDVGAHIGMLARIVWFTWLLVIVQVFQVRSKNLLVVLTWRWPVRAAFYVTLFYLTTIFGAFDVIEFIYFQF